jgi:hypothetical protein
MNIKALIPRLDKGIQDSDTYVSNHKIFYQN